MDIVTIPKQELTDSYVNFGDPILVVNRNKLSFFFDVDVNDSTDVDVKILSGVEPLSVDFESDNNVISLFTTTVADFKYEHVYDPEAAFYLQLQAKAGVLGAVPGALTITVTKKK